MTGERVFCSHLKGKVPTNPNLPTTRECYCPVFFPRPRKEPINPLTKKNSNAASWFIAFLHSFSNYPA